jgi:hypothetical protein
MSLLAMFTLHLAFPANFPPHPSAAVPCQWWSEQHHCTSLRKHLDAHHFRLAVA